MKGNEMKGVQQDMGLPQLHGGDKWTGSTNLTGFSSLEPTIILRSQRVRASMTTCTIHEHLKEAGYRDYPSVKRADCSLSRFDLDPQSILHLWSDDCRQGIPHCSHHRQQGKREKVRRQSAPAYTICAKHTRMTKCSWRQCKQCIAKNVWRTAHISTPPIPGLGRMRSVGWEQGAVCPSEINKYIDPLIIPATVRPLPR
jgi:hypothetical protein